MKKTIALIATLDTKGVETKYIKDQFITHGKRVIVIDSGILGEAHDIEPDFSRYEVAKHGGYNLDEIRNSGSRGEAVSQMSECVRAVIEKLYTERNIDGVMCVAGAGSMIAVPGMQKLPLGFPKLLVCPLLSGERVFEPFVGTSDIVLMHSVVDILGINGISQKIFDNAIGAMIGMVDNYTPAENEYENHIAITMFGQTTPGVMSAMKKLERSGYTCVIFHANGVGGRSMEELIEKGVFAGVLDYTLSEVAGEELGGLNKSSPTRMEIAGKYGIPQVIVPGCIDFLDVFPVDMEKPEYSDRKVYRHSPAIYLVRVKKGEMAKLGKVFSRKLNASKGPVEIVFPLKGLSQANAEGKALYDSEADNAFLESLKKNISKNIPVHVLDKHINDQLFAEFAAERLLALMRKKD
ncbi:MAG: Tm-1-like ATP-binding domain-containing protein [Spirochaetota bacterium]|nr:MAG: Tm-1-like ATP-binding domain-containing protein [Spirochaetota bacterium]